MGQKMDTFTIIGNVLISIYRFDVRHIWLDRKVNLENQQKQTSPAPTGAKPLQLPLTSFNLNEYIHSFAGGGGKCPRKI